MQISITQPPEDLAGDLIFTQPKYHFGQTLEDEKGTQGFVIGMDFDGEWSYTLFLTKAMTPSPPLEESKLATLTL